jgi:3-oxoacyl-[acyl-carrier protein] reductase
VVYGGAGRVGGAVAKAFAQEGARVFVAGRSIEPLREVVDEIAGAGGSAHALEVDALDDEAVEVLVDSVVEETGGIDVSFNAIGHGDVHGSPLLEMPFDDFARPITTAVRTQFVTTRAAARHMVPRGSGVILAITATTARMAIPNVGGTWVTFDAIESQCKQWARELGEYGVRVLWLRTTGLPEGLHGDVFPDYIGRRPEGLTRDELVAWLLGPPVLNRLTTLADVGNAAAFAASDSAGAMTGCCVNLTCGSVLE